MTTTLPEYPLKEVYLHDSVDDGWMVLFNYVFDVTSLLRHDGHPGGMEVILENVGRDGSLVFLGGGHEAVPMNRLRPLLVGVLPSSEHVHLAFPGWAEREAEIAALLRQV